MSKCETRSVARGGLTITGAALAILSAVCTLVGNWESLAGTNAANLLLYVILPMAAALGLAVMLLLQTKPVLLVLPVTLGGVLFVCMEAYLFQLVNGAEQFTHIWEYLEPQLAAVVMAAAIGIAASLALFLLLLLGIVRSDLVAMAVVGVTILLLAAEFIVNLLVYKQFSIPWYLLSVALFLGAMLIVILAMEPTEHRRNEQ